MKIIILSLFPEYFESVLNTSIIKRAVEAGTVEFEVINIRGFTQDKHQVTDDRPYGGGPGMVMKVEPIYRALDDLGLVDQAGLKSESQRSVPTQVILTSAKGDSFTQATAQTWSQLEQLVIICGHYEGVDERVVDHLIDQEVRVGDYVLTGGEPAAAVMLDAVSRLVPGVLGNDQSNQGESHSQPGVMAFPQYTRPEEFMGWSVPPVLLEGNHQQIADWREEHRAQKPKKQ
jgi:tRNA (guanine37-N1)-methyltransferase